MSDPLADERRKLLVAAFRMPSGTKIAGRTSSITNAFVISIIPVVVPSEQDIHDALTLLGMVAEDVRCAYCGDRGTEWDHLRPLVVKRRPTGYISEIGNLAPSCRPCNSSKGNRHWRAWMLSNARHSPTKRGLPNVDDRIARLHAYEDWRRPTKINFEEILGKDKWEHYWSLCDAVNKELHEAQRVAEQLRLTIVERLRGG
jgi:hypothetical protein